MMVHDADWTAFGWSNVRWKAMGGWGVVLFFAISGLLVCTRILEDEARFHEFRIRDFYVRRLLRIQPASLVYLATVGLLTIAGVTHERPAAFRGALFLYQNYIENLADRSGRWYLTGHFWTLSAEEHFYIILSLLLFFFRKHRAVVLAVVLGLLWSWVHVSLHFGWRTTNTSSRETQWVLKFLIGPALLAVLYREPRIRSGVVRYLRPWVVISTTLLFLLCRLALQARHLPMEPIDLIYFLSLNFNVFFLSFPFWVLATMTHPGSWTTRMLEWKPLRFVGRLSYSLYLWHVLFFVASVPEVGVHAHWLLFLCQRPWRYIATFAAAAASYYWVEKPLVRLGHRIAPPATSGHADLSVPADPPTLPSTLPAT